MTTKEVINVESIESNGLVTEVHKLFREACTVRYQSGINKSLQHGYIRDVIEGCEGEPFFTTTQEDCSNECKFNDRDQTDCNSELPDACSIEDALNHYKNISPFKCLANHLTTVKKYEFISLVEHAYAQIGNKPFQLKPGKNPIPSDDQIEEVAGEFYEFLENYLEVNEVRIDEITEAFNLDTLSEVTKTLADAAQEQADIKVREDINKNEDVLERVFQRSDFMTKYLEVIKDTTDYPIGVMWIDDVAFKKERILKNGKLALKYSIQSDAYRVDPVYFWATRDFRLNEVGRAVFRLTQFTEGDLRRWVDESLVGSKIIEENIENYLETYSDGYRMHEAMLFNDHYELHNGLYDVMITRGTYERKHLEELDIKIPDLYKDETYIPCEIHFSSHHILRVRAMEVADEHLGVYTTVFRRRGQSIFGYSLHEFIYPFAKLYAGAVDAIDRSVGKSVGSIIQIDTGVIEDPDKYLQKNEKTGEVELDLSQDMIVEFDSSNLFQAYNFKGVPITVTELPNDLNKLLPTIEFIHDQLERISGIPSILVNASNISSALRTNTNFNAAFASSAKVIQALLRESETRILEPSIRYIFDTKAASGEMGEFLSEVEPEILLSDTLTRELNDDQQLLQGFQTLAQFSQLIPQENLAKLINTIGRDLYNLDQDLIPGTGVLSTTQPSAPTQSV